MKGIVLAAGKGTRLYPMTKPVCKPLLPVFDKPLIYYPISVLMQAGISDILVIVPPDETETFRLLFGDGSQFGIKISIKEQLVPLGIADALLIGNDFVGSDSVCLILGDNMFYSSTLTATLKRAVQQTSGATVFGYYVDNPCPFGVVEFDNDCKVLSIEEKPDSPKSNYIIPGLYFYDNEVMDIARSLTPSARGELEITDVNLEYLHRNVLNIIPLDRNFTWMDAGTADSLLEAGQCIKEIQDSTSKYVSCLEEIALNEGWITRDQVHALGDEIDMTQYGKYLQSL